VKRKPLTEEDVYNAWLVPYHNITAKELAKKHPRLVKTPKWFSMYPVTGEQHDEWREWLVRALMKEWHCGKKCAERSLWLVYLNCAPSVKTA
jgi:hypothetical protein